VSRERDIAGVADEVLKEAAGAEPRRSAARRTAWLLAMLAAGFYLLFYLVESFR